MRFQQRDRRMSTSDQAKGLLSRFCKNEDGANAIEFAIVSLPFFMFIFGLIGMAFNFFIQNSIENGMSRTSRQIRTGEAQAKNMTVQGFKDELCQRAGSGKWIDCSQLQIFVQTAASWDQVQPTKCIDSSGNATVNGTPGGAPIADYAGEANSIVVVTGCYKWNFTKNIPMMRLGNMNDKSMMMQSMTAFRSEPYTPPQ